MLDGVTVGVMFFLGLTHLIAFLIGGCCGHSIGTLETEYKMFRENTVIPNPIEKKEEVPVRKKTPRKRTKKA